MPLVTSEPTMKGDALPRLEARTLSVKTFRRHRNEQIFIFVIQFRNVDATLLDVKESLREKKWPGTEGVRLDVLFPATPAQQSRLIFGPD